MLEIGRPPPCPLPVTGVGTATDALAVYFAIDPDRATALRPGPTSILELTVLGMAAPEGEHLYLDLSAYSFIATENGILSSARVLRPRPAPDPIFRTPGVS